MGSLSHPRADLYILFIRDCSQTIPTLYLLDGGAVPIFPVAGHKANKAEGLTMGRCDKLTFLFRFSEFYGSQTYPFEDPEPDFVDKLFPVEEATYGVFLYFGRWIEGFRLTLRDGEGKEGQERQTQKPPQK
jgi:hypothetical protein